MSAPRRPALGRGLAALIPGAHGDTGGPAPMATPEALPADRPPAALRLDQIDAAPSQPRARFDEARLAELAASLRTDGLLQPIVVRQVADRFQIIAGERRFRAAKLAGLQSVPVVIREASDAEAYQLALIENVQRADLDPIEEAEAYRFLVAECGLTHEQVARRVGKDRTTVSNALRLLKMPPSLQDAVITGALRAGHARALLTAPGEDQPRLAREAIEQGWSVREVERQARLAAQQPAPPSPTPKPPPRSSADEAVEDQLRAALGAPVRLHRRGHKGRIELRFHSLDELERLIDLIISLEGR